MKVYINEDKLSLLKEEEITFYGFFTQVKNFMKELLSGNVTAEPSDVLKSHGLGKKELIKKLLKRGLLKSNENITEVPNGEENGKLRASHTVKYSVPRENFETKFHRLYTELFENEWKKKSVLSNEKEEIQKILDNDSDNAYHKRGGYKIEENSTNIETYYHGGNLKDNLWHNHVLWLTPQDYYAKEYAEEQNSPLIWEIKIDESKLNSNSIYGMDDLEGGNGSFDPYDPDIETIQCAMKEGYNCYYMDYDSDNAEGLCLFSKEPIVSIRKLTQEEYDNINEWNELDESINLQEAINNQDAPLYHYTSIGNFFNIMKMNGGLGALRSTQNEGDQCICFARSKELDIKDSFGREIDVRLTLDPHKLNIPRGCTTKSYQARGYNDEFEERIVNNSNHQRFYIGNIKNALLSVDIYIDKGWGNELIWRNELEHLERTFEDNTDILHFFINESDFILNKKKDSYDLVTAKQFLRDFIERPHNDGYRVRMLGNMWRAQEIDREEEEREKEQKEINEGYNIAKWLREIIIDYCNKRNLFDEMPDFKDAINNGLYMLSKSQNLMKILDYLKNIDDEGAKELYIYSIVNKGTRTVDERIRSILVHLWYKKI